jgi:competence protein ComEC
MSVVALLANILVIPLVPFAMLFSAIAGVAGMLIPAFSAWLAIPARLVLTYMLDIAYWLSGLPFAQVLTTLTTIQMIILYAVLGCFAALLINKNNRLKKRLMKR